MRIVRALIAAATLSIVVLVVLAGTAAAHDPFVPPANTGNTGSAVTGSGGPFNPGGSQGSSTATNGSGTSNTSGSNANGSAGTGSTGSDQSTGANANGTGGAQNLPFTGRDPKPWFVIAYGLIALGASAVVFVKLSVL